MASGNFLAKLRWRRFHSPTLKYAVRFIKAGYEPIEASDDVDNFVLDPIGSLPSGMVRVLAGDVSLSGNQLHLDDFLIDKYEVTNRNFKKFVDAGGYRDPKYWKTPFVKDGRTLDFQQAMAFFVDKTDRPAGPNLVPGASGISGRDYNSGKALP